MNDTFAVAAKKKKKRKMSPVHRSLLQCALGAASEPETQTDWISSSGGPALFSVRSWRWWRGESWTNCYPSWTIRSIFSIFCSWMDSRALSPADGSQGALRETIQQTRARALYITEYSVDYSALFVLHDNILHTIICICIVPCMYTFVPFLPFIAISS